MAQNETPTLALGLLAFCAGVAVLLVAFVLGINIESTDGEVADVAKGKQIAGPAAVALVAGVVALTARRRRWGFLVACVGAVAAVAAVLLAFLLPGG